MKEMSNISNKFVDVLQPYTEEAQSLHKSPFMS